jgi:ADP-ribose pyrophosphatase YjhB (NUDIX family)
MLHLIPAPLHRAALRVAYRLRRHWRKARGTTHDGVSVIATDLEGRILLIRHSYGPHGWFLPGGGIHRGETSAEAAERELREETACTVRALTPLGVVEEELSGATHRSHLFTAMTADVPRADGREVIEARFFPTHSLPEPLGSRTRARLALWKSGGAKSGR